MATTLVQLYDHDRPTMKVGMTCLAETDRRHNPYQAVPIYELAIYTSEDEGTYLVEWKFLDRQADHPDKDNAFGEVHHHTAIYPTLLDALIGLATFKYAAWDHRSLISRYEYEDA